MCDVEFEKVFDNFFNIIIQLIISIYYYINNIIIYSIIFHISQEGYDDDGEGSMSCLIIQAS